MSTTTAPIEAPVVVPAEKAEPMSSRIVRFLTRTPVYIVLALIGLLWLVPTLGLFVTSLLEPAEIGTTGWWEVITSPSLATLDNYREILDNEAITSSLWTTLWISLGATFLPIAVASLAAYAFAWLEFPGRDWLFLVVVALLVVPIQMALIPIFSLYNDLGLFDTIPGLVLFHTAFGLPFAIFLLRNFFIGIPRDLLEAARIDGASEFRIFFRVILPLGPPGDRVTRDLPVPLGVERPARRADVRARHAADHRRDLLPDASVQRQHRAHRARLRSSRWRSRCRVLRLPALLRARLARRFRQVSPKGARCRPTSC